MTRQAGQGWLGRLRALAGYLVPGRTRLEVKQSGQAEEKPEDEIPCCRAAVHIAYRGVSDDRLYIAYARKWAEVKFFRPHGLRVFCAGCRRRLL